MAGLWSIESEDISPEPEYVEKEIQEKELRQFLMSIKSSISCKLIESLQTVLKGCCGLVRGEVYVFSPYLWGWICEMMKLTSKIQCTSIHFINCLRAIKQGQVVTICKGHHT